MKTPALLLAAMMCFLLMAFKSGTGEEVEMGTIHVRKPKEVRPAVPVYPMADFYTPPSTGSWSVRDYQAYDTPPSPVGNWNIPGFRKLKNKSVRPYCAQYADGRLCITDTLGRGVRFSVAQFTVNIIRAQSLTTYNRCGNYGSYEIRQLMQKMKSGDRIYFEEVVIMTEDGKLVKGVVSGLLLEKV